MLSDQCFHVAASPAFGNFEAITKPSKRTTCIDYMTQAHEAFEAGLIGDAVRYQTLRSVLDVRSRAWLDQLIETRNLEQKFHHLDSLAGTLPAPPPINLESSAVG